MRILHVSRERTGYLPKLASTYMELPGNQTCEKRLSRYNEASCGKLTLWKMGYGAEQQPELPAIFGRR